MENKSTEAFVPGNSLRHPSLAEHYAKKQSMPAAFPVREIPLNPNLIPIKKATFKDNMNSILSDFKTATATASADLWGFFDWLIPDDEVADLLGVENKVGQFFDTANRTNMAVVEEDRKIKAKASPGVAAFGTYIMQPAVRMAPNTIMAYATGGASAAASAGATLASGAATASTAARVIDSTATMMKSPMFWNSFMQTTGGSYNEALADGATESEAKAYAFLNGFLGATVEMGGGIETLPGTSQGMRSWVKSALEEGKEEVVQGVISQLAAAAMYEQDKEWYSWTNTDAVFNPARMAQEFFGGTILGGIMGGNQIAVNKAINSIRLYSAATQIGNQYIKAEGGHSIDEALQIGLSNAKGTDAYAAAKTIQERVNKGQSVSPYALGRMVMESQSDVAVRARAIEQTALQSAEQTRYPTDSAENIAAAAVKLNQPVVFGNAAQFQAGQAAYYDHDNQVVVLNPNVKEQALEGYVLAHEMVHSAQATQQMQALENTVQRMMGADQWTAYQAQVREEYASHGISLTDMQVRQEAIANWVGENLFKQGFAQMVAKGDAKTGGLLLRSLDKLRRAVGIKNSPSARDIAMLERLVMQAMENRTGTRSGEGVQYAQDNVPVVDLSTDNELAKRVEGVTGAEKCKVIQQYILDALGTEPFQLSDGKQAVVDRSDAHHIAYGSKKKREVAEVAEIKRLVETAHLCAEANNVEHKKFNYFYYYVALVKYNGELFPVYLNVGRAKNDGTYHLYDIKENIKDTAGQTTGLKRPKPNEGYALESGVSNTTVAQNAGGVNTHSMQNGGGNTQSAYISEDQFVDRMGGTPSTADGGATSLHEGGYGNGGAAQVDEAAVLESAVRSQLQGRPTAQASDIDGIIAELGEDVALRRMWSATQIDRPTGTVEIDGRRVSAEAYMNAYEDALPNDVAALEDTVHRLERERASAMAQMEQEGTLEEYAFGGLKIDLQLFAARRKWELAKYTMLDAGEEGKKARQFYEKRLAGKDATHSEELLAMLSGHEETYNPISTQRQLDMGKDKLRNAKYQADLIKRIKRYNRRDLFSAVDVAAAQVLINDAIHDGEYEQAMELITGLSRKGTELGRAVQAFSIMARLTPEGTLRMAQRTIKAEADYVIGEGASEGLDIMADDIMDAIREAERKGVSADEIADRIRHGRKSGDVDMIPYGAMQPQGDTANGAGAETEQRGMKPFDSIEPYDEPTYVDGVAQNTEPMTRGELVSALAEDLAAEERTYLSKEEIEDTLWKVVEDSTNIPEQVKRYVLKKLRKNDGGLAQRIYEIYRKGDLSQVKLRRAMEQALELPTLSDEDIVTLVDMATHCQELAEDPIAQADAMEEMYDFLAAKMSVNGLDRLQAWRKFGMLANVKTHLRNVSSNLAYVGIRKTDAAVSMALERMFRVKPENRAAFLGWSHTEHGQSILPTLREKAELAALEMQKRGAKYETGTGQLKQRRKFFGESKVGEALNTGNRWNSAMLEKEDLVFFKPAYIDALGQMMTAQGTTEITDAMHEKAMQRALESTFRADNAMSDVIGSLKRFQNSNKQGMRLFGHAMDVIIPFHKTPANIATQTIMHSPLGIAKGAYDLVQRSRGKSAATTADIINSFAKGITGSALLAIGVLLGQAGLFNTGFGKTEKERAADELAGLQENAFVFGGVSISFDWLQPAASPLIVGASMGQRLAEDGLSLSAVFGAVMDGTDSLFQMTMLQSLYDILGGYEAGATATAASVAENLVSQSVPTVIGQFARAIDPVQRKTTGDSDFETIVNQVLAKIPGLTYLLDPELDVWGNEVYRTGKPSGVNAVWNVVQQFVSPANAKVGTGNGDPISEEILRLYRSHGSAAVPTAVSRDDARDGGMDYVEINRRLGRVNRQAVEDFINNQWPYDVQVSVGGKKKKVTKYYRDMTDEERVRVLSRIYTNTKKEVTEPAPEKPTDTYFQDIYRRLN